MSHIQNLWYSFRPTPSQSLPGKQKNPSPSTSRHINKIIALMCIFSSILNCTYANQKNSIMNGWKYWPKVFLKANFCHQKVIKKQTGSAWNFLQPPVPVCRDAYISKSVPIPSEQRFLKIYFPSGKRGEKDYGVEKIIKIKPTRIIAHKFW